jgi:hypothetical protein
MSMSMRRARVIALLLFVGGCAGEEGDEDELALAAVGEACEQSSDCAEELSCEHLICLADDPGPHLEFLGPGELAAFAPGTSSLTVNVQVYEGDDPDHQLELDVYSGAPARVTHGTSFDAIPHSYFMLPLSPPLESGPHRLRGRLLHADGTPHENRGAVDHRILFVHDAEIPSTPQLVIVWPPPGYQHPAGRDLEVSVAVLPGTFTFTELGDECQPLPDCMPSFAPECRSACGPVSRGGHVKIYADDGEFPGCLADEGSLCEYNYVAAFGPLSSEVELLDGYMMRGVLEPAAVPESGPFTLHAALSYPSHILYPSREDVIHNSVEIEIIAPE